MIWELLLAIVGVKWVFPLLVRETILSWGGSFVGKKCKNAWMAVPLSAFFGPFGVKGTISLLKTKTSQLK